MFILDHSLHNKFVKMQESLLKRLLKRGISPKIFRFEKKRKILSMPKLRLVIYEFALQKT